MLFIKLISNFKEQFGTSTIFTYGGLDLERIRGSFITHEDGNEVAYVVFDGNILELPADSLEVTENDYHTAFASVEEELNQSIVNMELLKTQLQATQEALDFILMGGWK